MSSHDENATPRAIRNDVRRSRRTRTIGDDEVCLLCGEQNFVVLIRDRVSASVLQRFLHAHHVAFVANDEELVVVLCRNCHAKVHAELLEAGIDPKDKSDRTRPEVLATMLHALGLFLRLLGACLITWAEHQREFVHLLDAHFAWRAVVGVAW